MKAIVLDTPTGPDGLQYRDIAVSPIGSDDVIVKVHAISLNPVDVKTSHGKALFGSLQRNFPLILGWDIAGEITEVGSAETGFSIGDRVFGMVNFPGKGSAYAEYVAAPAAHLARIPDGVSYEDAAATTLAALTAWQNLIELGGLHEGQRVLIHAAGGGVGHYAVQLAKERGAYVIATSSASKRDFVLGLGADEHIDYEEQQFEDVIDPVDVVLDSRDPAHLDRSLKVLKPGGHLFTLAAGISDSLKQRANERDVLVTHHMVHSDGDQMRALAERLADGRLHAHVSKVYPFDELADAMRHVEEGSTEGKVVVSLY